MKKILGIVMAAVVAVALTGCSGSDDEPATQATVTTSQTDSAGSGGASAKGMVYGAYKAGDQTWFIDGDEAAKKVVEQHGDEFICVGAKMNPEEYLKAIDNVVANQAKGIVTCIPDQAMSRVIVDKYKEAGIPVVMCDDALQSDAGNKLAPWMGINAYVIGQVNGDWLAIYAKDNNLVEDEQYGLLLLTADTVFSCVPRAEGRYDNFTANCPGFPAERIFRADYDGTTSRRDVTATPVITAHPEIKKWLVARVDEEGTIGTVRALENAGLDEDTYIVGLGAYVTKNKWNGKGAKGTCMKAATYFSSDSVGRGSVEILYEVIGGKEIPLGTAVDAIVITPESYREVMGKAAE